METRRYFDGILEKTYNKVYSHSRFIEFQREFIEELEKRTLVGGEKIRSDEESEKFRREIDEFIKKRIY